MSYLLTLWLNEIVSSVLFQLIKKVPCDFPIIEIKSHPIDLSIKFMLLAHHAIEQVNLLLFSGVLVVYDSLDFVCDSF